MFEQKSTMSTPVAIVIAGVVIAGGVYATQLPPSAEVERQSSHESVTGFRTSHEEDHVRGNPDAKVTIIEFSDFECPFCAQFHPTLERIVRENPDVKWIYRHFPLSSIHSRAFNAAVASECAARLGGNDAFWAFADAAFENQQDLGDTLYMKAAADIGIDTDAFRTCLADETIAKKVQADADEAVAAGGRGTPFSVIVHTQGERIPFSGALPYEQVATLVKEALTN
ncbi:DsbA family protein [Candidatus Parcubacteria bacterium]|nr:DsbA family protein [Candidatus Parcubacteria bacterium]